MEKVNNGIPTNKDRIRFQKSDEWTTNLNKPAPLLQQEKSIP